MKREAWQSVDITAKDIEAARAFPRDFGLNSDAEHSAEIEAGEWSLGPIFRTRDSNLLETVNADALIDELESHEDISDDWTVTSCNHWAVGWVDHLSFRILGDDGQPSKVFCVLKAFNDALADYPCADDFELSRLEYEATVDNIEDAARAFETTDAFDAGECFSWFWDNDQSAIEPTDGGGGYPSKDEMHACLEALGYLASEFEKTGRDE